MTESSTSATTLKIRIRFDGAAPPSEPDYAPARFDQRRVMLVVGALALLLAAVFGLRGLMQNHSPEPVRVEDVPIAALSAPEPASVVPPAVEAIPPPPLQQTNRVVRAVLTGAPRANASVPELAGEVPAAAGMQRFYFFTEVHAVASRRFKHRWEYRGQAVAQIPFSPKGKKWTGSSSKQIPTHMQGAWRAVLVDDRGAELGSVAFTYGKELTTAQN